MFTLMYNKNREGRRGVKTSSLSPLYDVCDKEEISRSDGGPGEVSPQRSSEELAYV